MMNLLSGFRLGHWTDEAAATGCTVLLCPPGTVASCEVRGSSPGSRELALLAPDKKLNEITALLLTGGSAFGLAAADGVVRWLEERGLGYTTPWGKVPIVPAAVIFDLNVGPWEIRPGSEDGYRACEAASAEVTAMGNCGAGTGATVGKWAGMETRMKGGFGYAELRHEDLVVQAIVVVNAVGDIVGQDGHVIAGARARDGSFIGESGVPRTPHARPPADLSNTTLAALLTNARLDKRDCFRVAQRLHDGFARTIVPVHTSYDGDVSFVLSSGDLQEDIDLVAELGADAVGAAIRSAVRSARTLHDIPALTP